MPHTHRGNQILIPGYGAVPFWSQWFNYFWLAKNAESYADSLIDLVQGAVLTEDPVQGGPSWSASDGWSFNTDALRTSIVPADCNITCLIQFSERSAFMYINLFGAEEGGVGEIGLGWFDDGEGADYWWVQNGAGKANLGDLGTSGNIGFAGGDAYWNGVDVGNVAVGTPPGYPLFIGARNDDGSADQSWVRDIYAVGYAARVLTADQVAAAAAAMLAATS